MRQRMRLQLPARTGRAELPSLDGVAPPRAPRPSDEQSLAALMLRAFRGGVDDEGESIDDALREVRGYVAGESGTPMPECSLVVESDAAGRGALVAALLLTRFEGSPFVAYSMTHPEWARRGLARGLLLTAAAALGELGETHLRLVVTDGNVAAQRLYRSIGFEVESTGGEGSS